MNYILNALIAWSYDLDSGNICVIVTGWLIVVEATTFQIFTMGIVCGIQNKLHLKYKIKFRNMYIYLKY